MRQILFLIISGLLATALWAQTIPPPAALTTAFHLNDRILFQGDSITDGGRGRNADLNHILGHCYAYIIAAKYGAMLPERHLTFLNRGISGNKVSDLTQRWKADTLDLKPDILSILIGINDLNGNVSAEVYEQQYDKLLADTVKALPNARLVLCEPFGLPVGHFKDNWPKHRADLQERQQIVAKLGVKYHAVVVHMQKVFDDACNRAPADYWIWDGVHPTYSGHQLMADEWVRMVMQFKFPAAAVLPAGPHPATNANQDGPGLYRVSAGPGGKYTTTVRAKSREDATDKAMTTVVQQAMDHDENAEIKELKVERIGP